MRRLFLPLFATATVFGAGAQAFHDGDIIWPSATEFAKNVSKWKSDHSLTSDDNFFISRVRPRLRFRNVATQVNPDLVEGVNDK
ncbi:MAG: hypothetical protein K2K29_00145, partial [Muribaculaceae bacterium]|nr:hypothetical protein [Muribaculaceae bacterium]